MKVPHTEYLKIARKRKAGKTLKFIAKPYNISRERIRQILRDHFPEITAEVAGRAKKETRDQEREKETKLCACGCGTVIPKWKRHERKWYPTRQYFRGHQGRNRVPYERTPESRARSSIARKRGWATGKYKRTPSPETRLKISMATKRNWALGKYDNNSATHIRKLAKEPAVNLEDEMCSPHLNIDIGERND